MLQVLFYNLGNPAVLAFIFNLSKANLDRNSPLLTFWVLGEVDVVRKDVSGTRHFRTQIQRPATFCNTNSGNIGPGYGCIHRYAVRGINGNVFPLFQELSRTVTLFMKRYFKNQFIKVCFRYIGSGYINLRVLSPLSLSANLRLP